MSTYFKQCAAGTPPQFIDAYEKTGLFLTREAAKNCSPTEREQYEAAMDEYFALEDAQALKRHD